MAPQEEREIIPSEEVEREVAMTVCERERASFARAKPKPEEAPVMSQTGFSVVDMVCELVSYPMQETMSRSQVGMVLKTVGNG